MRHEWKRENARVVESDGPVDTSGMYPLKSPQSTFEVEMTKILFFIDKERDS